MSRRKMCRQMRTRSVFSSLGMDLHFWLAPSQRTNTKRCVRLILAATKTTTTTRAQAAGRPLLGRQELSSGCVARRLPVGKRAEQLSRSGWTPTRLHKFASPNCGRVGESVLAARAFCSFPFRSVAGVASSGLAWRPVRPQTNS